MKSGRKDVASSFLYAGQPVVGWSTALLMNALKGALGEVVVAQDHPLMRPGAPDSEPVHSTKDGSVAAQALGMALTGLRAGTLLTDASLAQESRVIGLSAKMHTPLCVVSVPDPNGTSHDAFEGFHRAIQAGAAGLIAADLQEAVDFSLLATRISERVLGPSVCAADFLQSKWDVASVLSHEPGLVEAFLGRASDEIPSPTPAQSMAFGSGRRRVPALLSDDLPAGLNPVHGPSHEYLASVASAAFFDSHFAEEIEEAFEEFGSLTGRHYSPIEAYRTEDADVVLIGYGSTGKRLIEEIDSLRVSLRIKVGAVRVVVANPIPYEQLRAVLRGKVAAALVDVTSGSTALSDALKTVAGPDCPEISSAHATARQRPSRTDLEAIVRRIVQNGFKPFSGFVVPDPDPARSRIPGLERTDQLIRRSYPNVPFVNTGKAAPDEAAPTAYFFGKDLPLIGESVGTFLRAYASAYGVNTAGRLLDPRPTVYAAAIKATGRLAVVFDVELLRRDEILRRLIPQTTVVVPVYGDKKQFWTTVPEAFRLAAAELNLNILGVECFERGERETDELGKHLHAFAVLGGAARCIDDNALSVESLGESLLRTLVHDKLPPKVAERLLESFQAGFQGASRISNSEAPARVVDAPETPWTLRRVDGSTNTIVDPARFWNSVGFEAASGRSTLLRPDPYLACRVVPAGTSAGSARASSTTPAWLPENCTGCGACWTFCPHSALPTAVFPSDQLLEAARSRMESRGGDTTQVQRLGKAIGKRVHKLIADDGLHRFTSAGTILREAADQVLTAAKFDEEAEQAARAEIESVIAEVETLRIAKTESFFDSRDEMTRGSGLLLAIAVDSDACTGCGICSAVCPDAAFDPSPLTPVETTGYRRSRELIAGMNANQDEIADADTIPKLSLRMMDSGAYYASVGGGSAEPGSGAAMAVHLVAGLAASRAHSRRSAIASELDRVATRLKEAIKKSLSRTSEINDFHEFASRIHELSDAGRQLDLDDLVDSGSGIDTARLEQLSAAILDVESLQEHYASGRGRHSGFVAVLGEAPSLLADAAFPQNPFNFPWINAEGSDPADLARGISDGLTREALDRIRRLRKARLVADDAFDPAEDLPTHVDELSDTESAFLPQVVLFTESLDGRLVASLKGETQLRVFWLDKLGTELVGESPLAPGWNPDLVYAQTVPSSPEHFLSSIETALECRETSLTRIYAPLPETQEFAPRDTVARMKSAVASRVFPLITYSPDRSLQWNERWSLDGNPAVGDDFAPGGESLTTAADWMAAEGRFLSYFEPLATSGAGQQVRVAGYLDAAEEERRDMTPYVELADAAGNLRRLRVSESALVSSTRVLLSWRLLQELAAVRSNLLDVARSAVEEEVRQRFEEEQTAIRAEMENRISELQDSYEAELRERLKSRLLRMSGFDGTSDTLAGWLADIERVGRGVASDDTKNAVDGG